MIGQLYSAKKMLIIASEIFTNRMEVLVDKNFPVRNGKIVWSRSAREWQ